MAKKTKCSSKRTHAGKQFRNPTFQCQLFMRIDFSLYLAVAGLLGTANIAMAQTRDSGSPTGAGTTRQEQVNNPGRAATTPGIKTDSDRDADDKRPPARDVEEDRLRRGDVERRRLRPIAEPNEFQRYVERATGRLLPVFGSQFFADSSDSFLPADNVPVNADYVVAAGDEIIVRAWGSIDMDYRATVDRNGLINLPKVGGFTVAGVKASGLENHLRAQIGRLFTNFSLNVTMGQLRGLKVFVVGPALQPGVYNLASQSTLLSAVVAAGGPAPQGSMRKISLRRDNRVVSELDIYEFLVQGDKSRDMQLVAGDVVVFQAAGPRVALSGATDMAAVFELKSTEEPVKEILRYAGGTSILANRNRVNLERIDPGQARAKRFVEEFRLDEGGREKLLRDGDVLSLLAISPEFANAVTLKGHVAQPLRSPWRPGMRIRDLIPDREALISSDFHIRKNLLVQVSPENDFEPASREASKDYERSTRDNRSNSKAPGSDIRAERAGNDNRTTPRQSVLPDVVTNRQTINPSALFDELNWDYAVIERLNAADLSTRIIPFNLGRAVLQDDPSQNIELLAGDVVTVYSQKDINVPVARRTRLVSLEGEVNAPGIYQLMPGETLRALIARAGGFTPQAYIYGLEFSREETRVRQRENLATATARLEALAATQAARTAANRRDDAATDATVSSATTRVQIARLSRIEPNGRIALELKPTISGPESLPEFALEHADRISVPARPGFITISGAVVNTNAFIWRAERTAGDYLELAGLDEGADVSGMFILRADGTVQHAANSRGTFGLGRGLQGQLLYPGDAVFVPSQLDFETWGRALVRNLKDWSQILSQFGLGAAAIQALRNN